MAFYDVVLHLDSGDEKILRMLLRNAANYLAALPNEKFSIEVVANAAGVTLFTKDHAELHELALPLVQQGVKLKMCANALAEKVIPADSLWPECMVVPAGLVEVVRLQRNGFAYIKP